MGLGLGFGLGNKERSKEDQRYCQAFVGNPGHLSGHFYIWDMILCKIQSTSAKHWMIRVTVLVLLAQWFFGKYKAFVLSLSSNQNMQVIIY